MKVLRLQTFFSPQFENDGDDDDLKMQTHHHHHLSQPYLAPSSSDAKKYVNKGRLHK